MSTIWQDLRFSIRLHARTPAVTIAALVTLALGVGANTAIFSFADALLFRPLPVREPDRVVALFHVAHDNPTNFSSFAHPDYVAIRDECPALESVAARAGLEVDIGEGDALERLPGEIVSHNYFEVIGMTPALGRWFTADEDRTRGTHPVAIISHALWTRRYAGSHDAIGRTIAIDGRPFTIVGVAPAAMRGFDVYEAPDVWVPLMMFDTVMPWMNSLGRSLFDNPTTHWVDVVARLRDGASLAAVQTELQAVGNRLTGEIIAVDPKWAWDIRAVLIDDARLGPPAARPLVRLTWLLGAVVGLVLLIACANVANLLLARSLARQREIGIRLALGAGRARLVRQLLTESLLLSTTAGVSGVLVGGWALHLMGAFEIGSFLPGLVMRIDTRVLVFTVVVTMATGLTFGLLPALQGSNVDVVPALKDGAPTAIGSRRAARLRQALVAAQVALSAVLLTGTGLALRTLVNLYSVPFGFDVGRVAVASLDLGPAHLSPEDGAAAHRRLIEQLSARPGVESASLALMTPFGGGRMANDLFWDTGTASGRGRTNVDMNVVGPDYFRTMGIPVKRGRAFTWQDRAGAPGVAIANEALAAELWPGQEAIGRRVWFWNPRGQDRPLDIVGIVRDGRYARSWRREARPFLFLPSGQMYFPTLSVLVRTATPSALTPGDVRREASAVAPGALVVRVEPVAAAMGQAVALERTSARLLTLFGVLAVVLAGVGIHGVVSIAVSARTREMGVRLALGASPASIARHILWSGVAPVLAGTAIGLGAALALSRLIAGLLFGVAANDPVTIVIVAVVLVAAAGAASVAPARRATRVDPVAALRAE